MNLIKVENKIFNLSMLIDAEFTPTPRWYDETTGQEKTGAARLELRFTSLQSEARTDYHGNYVGCEVLSPYCHILRGPEAEQAWATLNLMLDARADQP